MSAIIGSSFYQWWQGTKMGIWFQKHVDAFMQYLAVKFDIAIVALEALSHAWDPDAKGEITNLTDRVAKLEDGYN